MKNTVVKLITLLLAVVCTLCAALGCGKKEDVLDYLDVPALQQYDAAWSNYIPVGMTDTFGSTGCGMMSTVNAVRFLTGYFIDPRKLADYCSLDGSFTNEGTWRYRAFCEGGSVEKYFNQNSDIKVKFEKYWGGGTGAEQCDEYLDKGCACIIHIKGHFMCIAARDKESGKYYLLDSAVYSVRGTKINGVWLDSSSFAEGGACFVDDGFCALAPTEEAIEHELPPLDNSENLYSISVSTSKHGHAYIGETEQTHYLGVGGESVVLHIRPDKGYKCSAILINSEFKKIPNNGKEADYEIMILDENTTIQLTFERG